MTMTAHCLICNLSLEESHKHVNIFNIVDCTFNKLGGGETISNTLFEVLGQILNRPLSSVILHSQEMCQDCYSKAIAIVDVQNKLQKLQYEFVSSFNQTAYARTELASTNDVIQGITESLTSQTSNPKTEDLSQGDPSGSDFGRSTVSMGINLAIKREKNNSPLQEQETAIEESPDLERQYACEKCSKNFNSNDDWVEHVLIHLDAKPHVCSFCEKSFQSLNVLKVHERAHKGFKIYECEKCGRSFSERHYLNEHTLVVHSDRKPFKCSVCEREFARRKDMMTHLKLHSGERPHSCPHCPKKFVVRSRLNRHLKTHLQDRPHQCKICQKSFIRLNDFQVHERLHTGVKPYKCTECEKCFSSMSNIRAHERRHRNANKKKTETVNTPIPSDSVVDLSVDDHQSQGNAIDPLDMKPIKRGVKATESKKQDMEITVVEGRKSMERQPSHEVTLGPAIFSTGESQPADSTKVKQRLPSLVNFRNPPARSKSGESALSLSLDLSNVTLQSGESSATSQQPYVLMQFPLMPEPPPLVLYSAPRNHNQAAQIANSILAEPVSHNSASQMQMIRWDNTDEVDALLQDNSNGTLLAQSLFQSKEISDAF